MLFYCIFLDSLSTNISNQTVKYTYDKNGNLIKDLNKNINNVISLTKFPAICLL